MGVGVNGTAAAAAPLSFGDGWIDLDTEYGVVPDVDTDEVALDNARAINRAIEDNSGARLVLPAGAVFVRNGDPLVTGLHRFAAIRIVGDTERLVLSGRGRPSRALS